MIFTSLDIRTSVVLLCCGRCVSFREFFRYQADNGSLVFSMMEEADEGVYHCVATVAGVGSIRSISAHLDAACEFSVDRVYGSPHSLMWLFVCGCSRCSVIRKKRNVCQHGMSIRYVSTVCQQGMSTRFLVDVMHLDQWAVNLTLF